MINYVKKPNPAPVHEETEENRLDRIRKDLAERHRKADTDGTLRRAHQKAEDNRLI